MEEAFILASERIDVEALENASPGLGLQMQPSIDS